MDKKAKLLIALSSLLPLIGLASAQGNTAATMAMYAVSCLLCRVMQIIYFVIAFVAVIVIMFAGIKWITSADDPEARNSAKSTVFNAILGLFIVILAAYLVSWVLQNFFFSEGLTISNPLDIVINGCGSMCGET